MGKTRARARLSAADSRRARPPQKRGGGAGGVLLNSGQGLIVAQKKKRALPYCPFGAGYLLPFPLLVHPAKSNTRISHFARLFNSNHTRPIRMWLRGPGLWYFFFKMRSAKGMSAVPFFPCRFLVVSSCCQSNHSPRPKQLHWGTRPRPGADPGLSTCTGDHPPHSAAPPPRCCPEVGVPHALISSRPSWVWPWGRSRTYPHET